VTEKNLLEMTQQVDQSSFQLTISADEFAYLATELGFEPPLASQDRPVERPPVAVSRQLQVAEKSLINRGAIKRLDSGGVSIDRTLAGLVSVLFLARASLDVTISGQRQGQLRRVETHFITDLIVEHESVEERHILTALRDGTICVERVSHSLSLNNQPAAFDQPGSFVEESFVEVPRLIATDGEASGRQRLEELGASRDLAASLARALAHPVRQSALQLLDRSGLEPRVLRRLRFVEDVYGLWVFNTTDLNAEPQLHVIPCGAADALTYIEELIHEAVTTAA
jgi:hypothetical protein